MITITPQMRILLAVEPVAFRKGIDGLVGVCRQALAADPFGGTLFVFSSRSRQSLKILCYDGQGFWLCQKRLSQGRFSWWPSETGGQKTCRLDVHQIQLLLWNGNPTQSSAAPRWRAVVPVG
jgi:transposase